MKYKSFEVQALLDTPIGEVAELPKAGTPLEQPLVYDSAARALKELAREGALAVIDEQTTSVNGAELITGFSFRRLV